MGPTSQLFVVSHSWNPLKGSREPTLRSIVPLFHCEGSGWHIVPLRAHPSSRTKMGLLTLPLARAQTPLSRKYHPELNRHVVLFSCHFTIVMNHERLKIYNSVSENNHWAITFLSTLPVPYRCCRPFCFCSRSRSRRSGPGAANGHRRANLGGGTDGWLAGTRFSFERQGPQLHQSKGCKACLRGTGHQARTMY